MGDSNVEPVSSRETSQQNGGIKAAKEEDTMSPGSASDDNRPAIHLPLSVDPPGPNNPPRQLVWVVRTPAISRYV